MGAQITEAEMLEQFGKGVKAARIASGLTQDALTQAMQDRGFAFHQATIYKIENGHRKTPVTEAIALAEILGHSVEQLGAGEEGRNTSPLDDVNKNLSRVSRRMSVAVREQVQAILDVTLAADNAAADLSERDKQWLSKGLLDWTPANLGAEGYLFMDALVALDHPNSGEWTSATLKRLYYELEAIQRFSDDG